MAFAVSRVQNADGSWTLTNSDGTTSQVAANAGAGAGGGGYSWDPAQNAYVDSNGTPGQFSYSSESGGWIDANGNPISFDPTANPSTPAVGNPDGSSPISALSNAIPKNVKQAAYFVANPIGYGLDKLGVGPVAGLSDVTGGKADASSIVGPKVTDLPKDVGLNLPSNTTASSGGSTAAAATTPATTAAPFSIANTTPNANVAGTANRAGTTVTAPPDVVAPTNGFKASLVAGDVAQQAPITAGKVTTQNATAATVQKAGAVTADTFTAPTNNFKAGVTAGTVATQAPVTAQTVTAPQNNFKSSLVAGTVAAPQTITAQQIGSSITPDQQAAIDLAKAQANGTAPSAAQALLQKGIDQNVGTAYGLAASLQGRNPGMALNAGAVSAQNAIAKSAADMAALRAQEIATGTSTYNQYSTAAAGQELTRNTANQSANLTQQVDNVQNTINVLTGNRDAALKAGQQNQADQLTAQIENQKEQLSALQGNQTTDLNAKIATAQNNINVLTGNRDAALKAGLQNQADTLTAQIENQKTQLATLQSNQASTLAARTATAANETSANNLQAQLQTSASIANQTAQLDASKANAANQLAADIQSTLNNINVLTGNRDAALKAGQQNQADTLTAQIESQKEQLSAAQSNQAALLAAAQSTAANQTTLSTADLNAFTDAMKLNDSDKQQINQIGLQAWIEQTDDATKNRAITVAAQTAQSAASSALWGTIFGGLATGGTALAVTLLKAAPVAAAVAA